MQLAFVSRAARKSVALALIQPGQRTRDHRLHGVAQRLRFLDLLEQGLASNAEGLARHQLRHDVVVVGIEPLGHFASGGGLARRRAATAHAEQRVQRHRLVVLLAEAGGHGAQQRAPFQNLVIPGKVAHRHELQACRRLQLPVLGAQLAARLFQRFGGLLTRPIGLDSALQFALGADPGEPQIMNSSHDNTAVRQSLFKWQPLCRQTYMNQNQCLHP
ncbi:hypothetical protein D3C87_1438850 [compost metagenome]